MKRNVAYIKIAVCTQDPYIGKQIREYAAGFEIRGNVEIEVEVMKNCYHWRKRFCVGNTMISFVLGENCGILTAIP